MNQHRYFFLYKCIFFMALAGSVFLALTGCSLQPVADSEAGNPAIVSLGALISLPTALAYDTSSTPSKRRFTPGRQYEKDQAESMYLFVLLHNWFVNELVNGSGSSIRNYLEKHIAQLPWQAIIENGSCVIDSLTLHFEATYTPDARYPYYVVMEDRLAGKEWKVVSALNGDADNPEGWIYLFTNAPLDPRTDSLKIHVFFAKTAQSKRCDISIDQKLLVNTGDIAESFVYSWYETNGMVHVSGTTCHPYMTGFLPDTVGHCYTYTAVANRAQNIAVVNLGLPPASHPDTTRLFTDYGIAEMYGRAFIYNSIPDLDDTSKMVLVTSIKDSLNLVQIMLLMAYDTTFTLRSASQADSLTVADLRFYLELNRPIAALITNESDREKYAQLLWIFKLKQPVYFDAQGYLGNGSIVPVGFETLASTRCICAPFVPLQVKNLVINEP